MFPDQKKSMSYGDANNYQKHSQYRSAGGMGRQESPRTGYPQHGHDYRTAGGMSRQESPRTGYGYHQYQQGHARSPHYFQHDYRSNSSAPRPDPRNSYNPQAGYHQRDRNSSYTPSRSYGSPHQASSYKQGGNWKGNSYSSHSNKPTHHSRKNIDSRKSVNPTEAKTVTFEDKNEESSSSVVETKVVSSDGTDSTSSANGANQVALDSDQPLNQIEETLNSTFTKDGDDEKKEAENHPVVLDVTQSSILESVQVVKTVDIISEECESPGVVSVPDNQTSSEVNNLAGLVEETEISNVPSPSVVVESNRVESSAITEEVVADETVDECIQLSYEKVTEEIQKNDEEFDLELVYSGESDEASASPKKSEVSCNTVENMEVNDISSEKCTLSPPEIVVSDYDCDTKIVPEQVVVNISEKVEPQSEAENLEPEVAEAVQPVKIDITEECPVVKRVPELDPTPLVDAAAVQEIEENQKPEQEKENSNSTVENTPELKDSSSELGDNHAAPQKVTEEKNKDLTDMTNKLDDMCITPSKSSRKSRILLDTTNIVESSTIEYVLRETKNDVIMTPVRRSTRNKTPASVKVTKQSQTPDKFANAKKLPNPFLK